MLDVICILLMCHSYKMNEYTIISKEAVEESLMEYNPIHLDTIDFDHLHLINEINSVHNNITDDFKYILGSIMTLMGIYYFATDIIRSIYNR